jgi:glycosyltransferase involved in cell wall biosynthesis
MLCNGGSSHIEKWVTSLADSNIEVGIFSLQHFDEKVYTSHNVTILNNPPTSRASLLSKLGYIKNVGSIKKQIALYKPSILHAHYATSYGLLGTKTKFHPLVISAWGSDVYDFPKNSTLHKNLVKKIFTKADAICSTSNCMKEETQKYTDKKIEVVPFGVDTSIFHPLDSGLANKKAITVGIIKSLEKKYGIEFLIRAFHESVKLNPGKDLRLLIVGDGSKKDEYVALCGELKIDDRVTFTGKVKHADIPKYHQQIDIFVSLSVLDSESFGVSLVEAMACEKPVVASDVAGFREVLDNGKCGIIVPRNTYDEAARAITAYINDPAMAHAMGQRARKRVLENYDWKKNLEQMINIYQSLL